MIATTIHVVSGLVMLTLGLLIWKKQMITLIHDYHWKNVKEENKPFYTRRMGLACIIIAIGMFLAGVANWFWHTPFDMIFFFSFFGIGLITMTRAQYTYNGGIFSGKMWT